MSDRQTDAYIQETEELYEEIKNTKRDPKKRNGLVKSVLVNGNRQLLEGLKFLEDLSTKEEGLIVGYLESLMKSGKEEGKVDKIDFAFHLLIDYSVSNEILLDLYIEYGTASHSVFKHMIEVRAGASNGICSRKLDRIHRFKRAQVLLESSAVKKRDCGKHLLIGLAEDKFISFSDVADLLSENFVDLRQRVLDHFLYACSVEQTLERFVESIVDAATAEIYNESTTANEKEMYMHFIVSALKAVGETERLQSTVRRWDILVFIPVSIRKRALAQVVWESAHCVAD